MLKKLDSVHYLEETLSWEKLLAKISDYLVKTKITTSAFQKRVQDIVLQHGFYFLLNEEIVLVHTEIGAHILQTSFHLFFLKEGLIINNYKPHLFFVLTTTDAQAHLHLISTFAQTFRQAEKQKLLLEAPNLEALQKLLAHL